jgi:hypothetical protein
MPPLLGRLFRAGPPGRTAGSEPHSRAPGMGCEGRTVGLIGGREIMQWQVNIVVVDTMCHWYKNLIVDIII